MRRTFALMPVLALTIGIFAWGAWQQGTIVNTDMHSTDQFAYMTYAKNMARTNFKFVGGRNRMPVYPGLMSLFYKQGMSDEDFFKCGKNVGIAIGAAGIIVIFLLFCQISKPVDALASTLVATFTFLAYKAPYFQADVLFYIIGLLLFYLLLSLVERPKVRTAVLAGSVGGIGHLTKASVLPAVLLAAFFILLRVAFGLWRQYRRADTAAADFRRSRFILNHLCYIIVLLGCFLLVVFPYLRTSKERFGRYFYNVNSTFYMWYDSWEEAKQGTRAHGDRVGWPDVPEEQIPSFKKYVREHSFGQILGRLTHGFLVFGFNTVRSYGYAWFLLAYILMLVLLFIQNRGVLLPIFLSRLHPCVSLFIIGYFLGYSTLYAWYMPIASGNRFILSLFLPAMFIIVWIVSYASVHNLSFIFFGRRISSSGISRAILLFLIAYVLIVFPHGISTMYGGN